MNITRKNMWLILLAIAVFSLAGCDFIEDVFHPDARDESAAKTVPVADAPGSLNESLHRGDFSMFYGLYKDSADDEPVLIWVKDGATWKGTHDGMVLAKDKVTVKAHTNMAYPDSWARSDGAVSGRLERDIEVPIGSWEGYDYTYVIFPENTIEGGFISLKTSDGTLMGVVTYYIFNGQLGDVVLALGEGHSGPGELNPRPKIPPKTTWNIINGNPVFRPN